jgi:GDPmannose 4,6-dehydratase
MNKNVALVTGVTGQIGSYIAELLLDKNYKVYGLRRRSSVFNTERIDHIYNDVHVDNKLELIYGDLSDSSSIDSIVDDIKPELFFNMAAQSHVRLSFDIPCSTADITGVGVVRCLEAIHKYSPDTRFITASSSEMFGDSAPPQSENTLMRPRSIYAAAKLFGFNSVVNYRESYGMHASNAIMFNTEGVRRGETFVTKKITRAATRISLGLQDKLYLGNLDAYRDWNWAPSVANAVYMIITAETPNDYCIGSGKSNSIREFLDLAFNKVGLNWKDYVEFDERYIRATEVNHLKADSSKIQKDLGWVPDYDLEFIVTKMIEHDLELAKKEKLIKGRI